jgi:hypothetical protein
MDKNGYCMVMMLTGESEARHYYRAYIMDIAHPDVDGVAEHIYVP